MTLINLIVSFVFDFVGHKNKTKLIHNVIAISIFFFLHLDRVTAKPTPLKDTIQNKMLIQKAEQLHNVTAIYFFFFLHVSRVTAKSPPLAYSWS